MRLAFLLLALPLAVSSVCARAQATVRADAEFFAAPGGAAVAVLHPGIDLKTGSTRGALTQVTLVGYVNASALGGKRDTFALSVKAPSGAMLRSEARSDGKAVARLNDGLGLVRESSAGEWAKVRRAGWIATAQLQSAAPAPVAKAATPSPIIDTARTPLPNEMTPLRRTALGNAPGSSPVATVEPGARIEPMARERGWVKVKVEGWMREGDLAAVDTSVRNTVTAADLRSDPNAWRGRTVRWEVEVIALQVADALRKELALDEPYLLARGPGGDNSLLYLALPPALAAAGREAASPPLKHYVVTARVRTGKSDPSGVPILDVLTLTKR